MGYFLSKVRNSSDFQAHSPTMKAKSGKKNESLSKSLVIPVEASVAPKIPVVVTYTLAVAVVEVVSLLVADAEFTSVVWP